MKYSSLGAGLICPAANAVQLILELESIHANGIAQDIAENGIKAIIHRELANHEAQITGDMSSTIAALEAYPITRDEVRAEWSEFYQHCVDNDYF